MNAPMPAEAPIPQVDPEAVETDRGRMIVREKSPETAPPVSSPATPATQDTK